MAEPTPHTQAKRLADNIEAKFFNRPTENAGQRELRAFEEKAQSRVHDYSLTGPTATLKRQWQDAVIYLADRIEKLET